MDKASIGGVFLAFAGIVAGLFIEGGNLGQIFQPTAALIVFGGTMGAVLLQFPFHTVVAAFRSLAHLFSATRKHDGQLILQLVAFANKARRQGVVSLDADLRSIEEPFLRQALMLAIDGTEPSELRKIMQVSLESATENQERLPADSRPPSVSLAPCSASSRSCNILTTLKRLAAESPLPLSPPSTESASPISSSCRWPAKCAFKSAKTT